MAHHELRTYPLVLRNLSVLRSTKVSETMLRVTLGGEELAVRERDGLRLAAFDSAGFDDHVKLIFGSTVVEGSQPELGVLPVQQSGGIDWPVSEHRQTRDYTPRRFDPELGELDLDFVLHGDGPAAQWALGTKPGSDVWLVGPKSTTLLPDDLDWIWLVGDETALPAIARFLAERPSQAAVRAIIVVPTESSEQELNLGPQDEVLWLHGSATDRELIETAVRAQPAPAGTGYFWAAGESRTLLGLRRFARKILELPPSHINITGYWHQEEEVQPSASGQSVAAAPAEQGEAPSVPLVAGATSGHGEPASPLGWFVLRAALQLGMLDALADAPAGLSRTKLAETLGVPLPRLAVLFDQLEQDGVLLSSAVDGSAPGVESILNLGRYAEELVEDEHEREKYEGFYAQTVLAMQELGPALREGISAWSAHHGQTLRQQALQSEEIAAELVEEAERIRFVSASLLPLGLWHGLKRVTLTGPGSAALAADLQLAEPSISWSVTEEPIFLEAFRADLSQSPRHSTVDQGAQPGGPIGFSARWQPAELIVSVLELSLFSDAELLTRLQHYAEHTRRLLVIEGLRPDGLSPNGRQQLVFREVRTASGGRGPAEFGALAAQAGWTISRSEALGWDIEVFELLRA
ncbi:siderophore-interacting protein [Psychromicrobium lacuslunae]|uniref:FAD-binding FR-type domain-containing protein n=1 Tax=Psychromicrobium lacuslunae TaxID=1618207 RepID=A0A0D4C1H7_9MICC|nr:siderophore-interacting protein [Psychromicrobium lacuslunae]AJT42206.1 hypothetical protein UM93_13100 [Psychromicrobium lacuslunae]